ncbi:MAG: TVP38/TMEM64 family protein [Clostridium sp.]
MKNKSLVKSTIAIIFASISVLLVYIFLKVTGISISTFSVEGVEKILQDNKGSSVTIYMFLNLIRPLFIIIPVWIFGVVAGVIYGPILGIIYSLIGIFISATVAFYFARFVGRDFIGAMIGDKLHRVDNKLEQNGFKFLFIMRISVVCPFDPLSFMAGISRMKYKTYITSTMLGVIPETIAFNYLGIGLKSILSFKVIIILFIIIILVIIPFVIRKKWCKIRSR